MKRLFSKIFSSTALHLVKRKLTCKHRHNLTYPLEKKTTNNNKKKPKQALFKILCYIFLKEKKIWLNQSIIGENQTIYDNF